jgi:hypothetical protein
MAHFANVKGNSVVKVIVADYEFINFLIGKSGGEWIQTSYNTRGGVHYGQDGQPDGGIALRKNYAGIGFTYDRDRDAFIPQKPFPSWILNEDTCLWDAPVPYPQDGKNYTWDEDVLNWIEVT